MRSWGQVSTFLVDFISYPLTPPSLPASSTNLEGSVVMLASMCILKTEVVVCSMVMWLVNRREDYRGIYII